MMDELDSRHGTYAGYIAHFKAKAQPCLACAQAARRFRKTARLEAHRGAPRTCPLGDAAWHIITTATPQHLARSGVTLSTTFRLRRLGPETIVRRSTRDAILATQLPTAIGVQRRLRALCAIGWTMRALAHESGSEWADNLRTLLMREPLVYVRQEMTEQVIGMYDRLSDTPAPDSRAATRARNRAAREGWPPPMAYDDIDNPDEVPAGRYEPATRADLLREYVDRGDNLTMVCRALGLTVNTLNSWCCNNGHSDLYRTLASREGDWNSGGRISREYVA